MKVLTDSGLTTFWNKIKSYVTGNVYNPDNEDISSYTSSGSKILRLADRTYNASNFSGNGYKILRKNIKTVNNVKKNVLEQSMINSANTIYEIRYDFDLNGATITIPSGCTLTFEGGSLNNGTVNFNDTIINGNFFEHISSTLKYNVKFYNGNREVCVDDFGADPTGAKVSTDAINKAIQYAKYNKIVRPITFYGNYLIDDAIMLESDITLQGNNSTISWNKLKGTKVFGNDLFREEGYKNIKIQGFVVDCDNDWTYIYEDGKDKSNPRGVFALANVNGLVIEDCKRTYPGLIQPAWIYGCSNVTFRNCRFERTLTAEEFSGESNGIWIYSAGKECKNYLIEDCFIKGYRDECIGVIDSSLVNNDWSQDTSTSGFIENVEIRNNILVGGSYAITISRSLVDKRGYVKDVRIHDNVIKNSTIIVRAHAQGNQVIENNSFYFEESPNSAIELIQVEHIQDSKKDLIRISNNKYYGATSNVRFLAIGKCNELIIENNTFSSNNGAEAAVTLRGPMSRGVIIRGNYIKGYYGFSLTNNIVGTNIEILNNKIIGYCAINLGDNGNPFILKIYNNHFNTSSILVAAGSGHLSDTSVFSNNLIEGANNTVFLNSIFSTKNVGFNEFIFADGGSRLMYGNITNVTYEGYCQPLANNTNVKGITIGSSRNVPMIISKNEVHTLRGAKIPQEALGANAVYAMGALIYAPTTYMKEENKGYIYYDTDHNCTIEWDGKKWVPVDCKTGSTSERPTFDTKAASIYNGLQYYDTTLKKPIWWNGSKWVDATGAAV